MHTLTLINIALTAGCLIVSGISLFMKIRENNRKKAKIVAEVYKSESEITVVIMNKGKSDADNIRFSSNEMTVNVCYIREHFYRTYLSPNDRFDIKMKLDKQNIAPVKVKFTWDDKFCKNNEREQTLIL
jgi:hypothetical protein